MTDNPDLAEAIDILRNWKGIMPVALVDRVQALLAKHPERPKLDGCPWCGDEPELARPEPDSAMRRGYCHNCGVYGPWGADEADAAAAWNRRAKADDPDRDEAIRLLRLWNSAIELSSEMLAETAALLAKYPAKPASGPVSGGKAG